MLIKYSWCCRGGKLGIKIFSPDLNVIKKLLEEEEIYRSFSFEEEKGEGYYLDVGLLNKQKIKQVDTLMRKHFVNLAENKVLVSFYSNAGLQISNPDCYPESIQSFLATEREKLTNLLAEGKYTTLLEVGCGASMVNASIARHSGCKYVGVDVVRSVVKKAKQEIKRMNAKNMDVYCCSVVNYEELARLIPEDERAKTLVFLPFNLIGNIGNLVEFLDCVSRLGVGVAISSYQVNPQAQQERRAYYLRCGFTQLEEHHYSGVGVMMTSKEGLRSIAYETSFLRALGMWFGMNIQVTSSQGLNVFSQCSSVGFSEDGRRVRESDTLPVLSWFAANERSVLTTSLAPLTPPARGSARSRGGVPPSFNREGELAVHHVESYCTLHSYSPRRCTRE